MEESDISVSEEADSYSTGMERHESESEEPETGKLHWV